MLRDRNNVGDCGKVLVRWYEATEVDGWDDRVDGRPGDDRDESTRGGRAMRWDELFADLGAQWEAEARRELDGEVADRTRRERALVGLHERLSAARGCAGRR